MKIVVVSDSHGKAGILEQILQQHKDADAFLHCGDIEAEPDIYPQYITVQGNNDLYYDYPDHRMLTLGGHRILIAHGHQFLYAQRNMRIASKAIELKCDIVCTGHTHVAMHEVVNGIHIINPGSLWRSRDGRGPSYAIMTLEQGGVDVEFCFLDSNKAKR